MRSLDKLDKKDKKSTIAEAIEIGKKMEMAVERLAGLRGKDGGRVFSLVSGGIDSAVAAALALKAGLCVTGATMINHPAASGDGAISLCRELGIELMTFDLRGSFEELVLAPFEEAYRSGRTPNPCTICNRAVKLGALWDRIAENAGSDDFTVMTGHYARAESDAGDISLRRAADRKKDQSYFLCMLPISKVRRLALPLGDFTKREVREMAGILGSDFGLSGFFDRLLQKPESMDICFDTGGGYRRSLGAGGEPGNIVDTGGNILGRHSGIENFTIGQRKGLGVSAREPMFVIEIRPENRSVVVAERALAETRYVTATGVNVLSESRYLDGARLEGKIRSQSAASPCTISLPETGEVTACFDDPQFAPAPGQYLVLYDGDILVAGGEITG